MAQEQRPPMKPCDTLANQITYLERWYDEHVVGTATMGVQGQLVEVIWTASSNTGSWSMLYMKPQTGEACLFAGGEKMTFMKTTWGQQI